MPRLLDARDMDIGRYHDYRNHSSTALSELSTLVGLPGRILTYGFPDLFRWLAKHRKAARAVSIVVAVLLTSSALIMKVVPCIKYIISCFAASVVVSRDDDLYSYLIRFLWKKKILTPQCTAAGQSIDYLFNTDTEIRIFAKDNDGARVDRKAISYLSQSKFAVFRHGGRFFLLVRQGAELLDWSKGGSADKTKHIRLWCLGRSMAPIESLLQEAVDGYKQEVENGFTEVWVNRDAGSWGWAGTKPCRPIDSVDMHTDLKEPLLTDIAQFFDLDTKAWYRSRGLPYRRGYLFHGAPGTGKSSLVFAIAGHFGLGIYSVSLRDSSLNDSDLPQLFRKVNRRSLLLLEDIDSAGLDRESQFRVNDTRDTKSEHSEQVSDGADKKAKLRSKSSVTLSGLLNAIDGVIAPEGHILIMTSNRPETLDPALVRPGRVDVNVEFGLASRLQAESIFRRMYKHTGNDSKTSGHTLQVTEDQIAVLAKQFAAKIPDGLLSPADVQDYMIVRRSRPQRAVDEADQWVQERRLAVEKAKQDAMAKHTNMSTTFLKTLQQYITVWC